MKKLRHIGYISCWAVMVDKPAGYWTESAKRLALKKLQQIAMHYTVKDDVKGFGRQSGG